MGDLITDQMFITIVIATMMAALVAWIIWTTFKTK